MKTTSKDSIPALRTLRRSLRAAVLLGALILAGCAAQKQASGGQAEEHLPALPESYAGHQVRDTVNVAALDWEEFFPDTLLRSYIGAALAHNHSLQQAFERVAAARSRVRAAKAALLPQLSAGVTAGVQRFGEYTMDGVGNSTTNTPDLARDRHIPDPYPEYGIGVQFSWEADIWGRLTHGKRAAAARYAASAEAAQYARTMLIAEVATQYFELVGLDRRRRLLEEVIRETEESYRLTLEMKREGEMTQLAVDQFGSHLLGLRGELLAAEQMTREQESALCLLMGELPHALRRTSFDGMRRLVFRTEAGVPAQLMALRPDIRAAEARLAAARADTKAARRAFFPALTLGAAGGFSAFDAGKWFTAPASLAYDLAAGLTAPLFNRREIRTLWEEARSQQRIALASYHETVLKAYAEVTDRLAAHENMILRGNLKQEQRRTLFRAVENARELFQYNFIGYLEVLSADQLYLECELEYIRLSTDRCINQVQLYRVLGGGTLREADNRAEKERREEENTGE